MPTKSEFTVEQIINPNHTDESGQACQRIRQLKLYYMKGRGIVLSITTLDRKEGSNAHMMFSEGNTSVAIERLSRPKPTMLAAFGHALETEADRIFADMTGYDDDALWSDERRKAFVQETLVPLVRGQPVPA